MKNKKLYQIVKAKCIVSRNGGIKEIEEFSFLFNDKDCHRLVVNVYNLLKVCLQKQIDFYNAFCPEDYVISKFENEKFEQVGELWL